MRQCNQAIKGRRRGPTDGQAGWRRRKRKAKGGGQQMLGPGVINMHSRGSDSWTNGWGDGGLPTQQFSGR
ncbi:hypothetical protein V8C37DRAFT_375728 [Trichoderma ceciliae]